jgi:hypothetical protein
MSVLCQAMHARPEPFAISSHTAGHLSGGAPDPGTIPTKVSNCSRLGPGTPSMPAISGSAKSWNHPNILPDMGGHGPVGSACVEAVGPWLHAACRRMV